MNTASTTAPSHCICPMARNAALGSTPNLTELLKVFSANRQQVDAMIFGTWAGRFRFG